MAARRPKLSDICGDMAHVLDHLNTMSNSIVRIEERLIVKEEKLIKMENDIKLVKRFALAAVFVLVLTGEGEKIVKFVLPLFA